MVDGSKHQKRSCRLAKRFLTAESQSFRGDRQPRIQICKTVVMPAVPIAYREQAARIAYSAYAAVTDSERAAIELAKPIDARPPQNWSESRTRPRQGQSRLVLGKLGQPRRHFPDLRPCQIRFS